VKSEKQFAALIRDVSISITRMRVTACGPSGGGKREGRMEKWFGEEPSPGTRERALPDGLETAEGK
jgi:hypothetical protein